MSGHLINPFPDLCLSDEEKRVVGHYPNAQRPGVLPRLYTYQLIASGIAGDTPRLSARLIPSGRRCKLYAMTFSGDLETWSLQPSLTSGEKIFTAPTRITALLNAASTIGTAAAQDYTEDSTLLQRTTYQPYTFDPPIILEGTQALTLDGTCLVDLTAAERSVLNICCWCWEFPISAVRNAPRGV